MKPSYNTLYMNYPRSELQADLFATLGWGDLIGKAAYSNTCATRMSVALVRSGVILPGARFTAKAGVIKGKAIEPGQGKLSVILKRLWGEPEVYRDEEAARAGIAGRGGVVSFFRIHRGGPLDGGHIDIVMPGRQAFQDCARSCFFGAAEIWFWPLK